MRKTRSNTRRRMRAAMRNALLAAYKKHREIVLYGVVGVATTILNISLFYLLVHVAGMDYKWGNLITLVVVKAAAFFGNKWIVFQSITRNWLEFFLELWRYILSRALTTALEFAGLMLLVELLHADDMISKIIVTIAVIVSNFFFGKSFVFRKKNASPAQE